MASSYILPHNLQGPSKLPLSLDNRCFLSRNQLRAQNLEMRWRFLSWKVMHYFLFFHFSWVFLCLLFSLSLSLSLTHTHTHTHTQIHSHRFLDLKVLQKIFLGKNCFFFGCLCFEYFLKSNTSEHFQSICWKVCSIWSSNFHDFN